MHAITAIVLSLLPVALSKDLHTTFLTPKVARRATNTSSAPFTLIAARSGSPIHLQSINANNASFWIGKLTLSYCIPEIPASDCPPGNATALRVGSDGGAGMDTDVPGGQIVYVLPTGALAFTEPHAEGTPEENNGTTSGFVYTDIPGDALGEFGFTGLGADGFVACPSLNGSAPWQIFVDFPGLCDGHVPGGNVSKCLGFDALGEPYMGVEGQAAAWEYE